MHLGDEIFDHVFRNFDVGNHPIAQWPDGLHIARSLAHHQLRVIAHGFHLAAAIDRFDCNYRWFVEHNSAPANINQRVGGAQIDGHVLAQKSENAIEETHEQHPSLMRPFADGLPQARLCRAACGVRLAENTGTRQFCWLGCRIGRADRRCKRRVTHSVFRSPLAHGPPQCKTNGHHDHPPASLPPG